jgi:hypothetical protein
MGIVSDAIRSLIARQVDDHGIVVWYDPERHYASLVPDLGLADASVVTYGGSFFALRHQVESLLAGPERPRLLVYVPLAPEQSEQALAELEAAGGAACPGGKPPRSCNSKLAIVARAGLRAANGMATAAALEKKIDAGELTLADLDELASHDEGLAQGAVVLIFKSINPEEIALAFVTGDRFHAELRKKNAVAELAALFQAAFDLPAANAADPQTLRERLAAHLLATDLAVALADGTAELLERLPAASGAVAREACVRVVSAWRQRRDLRDSYAAQARRVEQALGLAGLALGPEHAGAETFSAVEQALLRATGAALRQSPSEVWLRLAEVRQAGFWAEHEPRLQAHWALLAAAGQVLRQADRIAAELRSQPDDARAAFDAYSTRSEPWCLLDTWHRHLERRCHNFDFDGSPDHEELAGLVTRARQRYTEVAGDVAEFFLRCCQAARFRLSGVPRQVEFHARHVRPLLDEGRVACVWVDALRFEMARELAGLAANEFDVRLEAVLAAAPTITAVGMASLLPGAEQGVLAATEGGKLAVVLDGRPLRERKERLAYLKERAGVPVAEARLDELLPAPRKRLAEALQTARLIVVTSQEIDALCEEDNVPLARRTMDDMLHELRRVFRLLADLGVAAILVSADHGYVFGEELEEGMKIDPPAAAAVELHRRAWVGHGAPSDPRYARVRPSDLGLGGDLELAVPWNLACFKVRGGARAYFHGGLSPQEAVVPVLTLVPHRRPAAGAGPLIHWELTPGSPKLTTRFFSVQVSGKMEGLFDRAAPKVRVEVRARGKAVSTPVSASYGFEEATGDVQLHCRAEDARSIDPDTVTLLVEDTAGHKTVSVHLLDTATGAELRRLERIEVAISI